MTSAVQPPRPSPAFKKTVEMLSNAAKQAAKEAIEAGADGLTDDDAFWRQVERVLGRDRYEPIFEYAGPAVVAAICEREIKSAKKLNFSRALSLRTLREAARRRAA